MATDKRKPMPCAPMELIDGTLVIGAPEPAVADTDNIRQAVKLLAAGRVIYIRTHGGRPALVRAAWELRKVH